jgi:methyltransferase-like protein
MEYTTNQKGLITEMEVMLAIIKLGYNVSQPLNADSKYDCIADINNKLIRIQVKTSHLSNTTKDSIKFKCSSTTTTQNHRKQTGYTSNDVDYFATCWKGQVYLIPVNECSSEKTLHLIKDKIHSTWSYAEDYLLEEVISRI